MDSLKERDMADEYIYFDVESFHQFLEFIIGEPVFSTLKLLTLEISTNAVPTLKCG